jgi:hypothetical protein
VGPTGHFDEDLLLLSRAELPAPATLASQETVFATLAEWLSDSACNRNPAVLVVAGLLHLAEGNAPDALKACHAEAAHNLELCVAFCNLLAHSWFLQHDASNAALPTHAVPAAKRYACKPTCK